MPALAFQTQYAGKPETIGGTRTNGSDEAYNCDARDGVADEVGLAGAVEGGAGAVAGVVVGGCLGSGGLCQLWS